MPASGCLHIPKRLHTRINGEVSIQARSTLVFPLKLFKMVFLPPSCAFHRLLGTHLISTTQVKASSVGTVFQQNQIPQP
eukprot:scaffold154_cov373-Prasinococcus_capsulatus_cf.AAC.7